MRLAGVVTGTLAAATLLGAPQAQAGFGVAIVVGHQEGYGYRDAYRAGY